MHVVECYDRGLEKFCRLLRDDVSGADFFPRAFQFWKKLRGGAVQSCIHGQGQVIMRVAGFHDRDLGLLLKGHIRLMNFFTLSMANNRAKMVLLIRKKDMCLLKLFSLCWILQFFSAEIGSKAKLAQLRHINSLKHHGMNILGAGFQNKTTLH